MNAFTNKVLFVSFLLLEITHSLTIFALTPDPAPSNTPPFMNVYAGPEVTSLKVSIRDLAHFHGTLAGATLGYVYEKPNSLYATAFVNWAIGSIRSSGQPSRFLHDETIEGRLGYTWAFYQGKMHLCPSIGYGFHYLIEKREQNADYTSLKFSYQNYYLPLGLLWKYFFHEKCSIGLSLSQRYDVSPSVKISDLHGAAWTLKHKMGTLIALPLEGFMGQANRWSVCLEPFWQEFQLGASTATSSSGTPLGITTQTFHEWGGLLMLNAYF